MNGLFCRNFCHNKYIQFKSTSFKKMEFKHDELLDDDLDEAPPEFKCPITLSIMKHPVLMPDGQTYELEAIKKALSFKPLSPVTRQPMKMNQGITNYALKNLIEKYIREKEIKLPEQKKDATRDYDQICKKEKELYEKCLILTKSISCSLYCIFETTLIFILNMIFMNLRGMYTVMKAILGFVIYCIIVLADFIFEEVILSLLYMILWPFALIINLVELLLLEIFDLMETIIEII